MMKSRTLSAWIASIGAVTCVGALTLSTVLAPAPLALAGAYAEPIVAKQSQHALEIAEALSNAFENVAEAIAPGVVSVRTEQEIQLRRAYAPQIPEEFRRFFGDRFVPFEQPPRGPESRLQRGQGSGFVISSDGHIVTNNHVIENADTITVTFTDGRTYSAELVGADPQTDLAVLRVDATDLTPLKLGDSDELRVGAFVVAAGSPFGLDSTITTGIVSATGRSRMGIAQYEEFIQTDAAINPGNSGGPLVNLRGEVVGVNSAILTRSGGNNGIGFAIPINMVKSITQTLIDEGHVTRGFLGVIIQDLTPELAQSFGFDGTAGALIAEVQPGTPADDAGIQSGDIVTSLNGRAIASMDELRLRIAEIRPGDKAEMEIFRDGKSMTITATIGDTPGSRVATAKAPVNELADSLGAEFSTLTPQAAERLGLSTSMSGVLVESVRPLGAAARAGLRPGEVIVRVHNRPVADVAEFSKALEEHDLRRGVRLTVRTSAGVRFVYLTTSQR